MTYKKKQLWWWLSFPFRLYHRYTHRRRFADLDDYVIAYEATLTTTLKMIEDGLNSDVLPQLSPVYLDPQEPDVFDFLVPKPDRVYHDDLHSFVETQQQTRRTGAWTGFACLMTIQPQLCLRISRRIHDYAVRYTPINRRTDTPAMPIGLSSIYVLMILNNMLFLHHLMETASVKTSVIRSFFKRHGYLYTALKREIDLGFQALQKCSSYREWGDMVFLHSVMPFAVNLQEHDHLIPYVNRLMDSSPLTNAIDLADSSIWAHTGSTELAGIERLLDDTCPFYFTGLIVQHWVDAIIAFQGEEQRQVFSHIEHILDYLCSDSSVPTAPGVPHIQSGRRCLVQFTRMLIRSWPDEQHQEKLFDLSADQSIIWYDILTRVRQRIDDMGPSGDRAWDSQKTRPVLSEQDDHMLRHSIVLAQRSMGRVAS